MDKDTRVAIKNEAKGSVGLNVPELHISRNFENKGVIRYMPYGELEAAMYYAGVEYLFKNGILSIEDMEVKKALGLEPPDAEEPTNIIILSDSDKDRYWRKMSTAEFRQAIGGISIEQIRSLADYAVDNEIMNIEKSDIVKSVIGTDVISAIRINRQQKEVQ